VPGDHEDRMATATAALRFPMRRVSRQYWAAR
jgi:hypothetical protein